MSYPQPSSEAIAAAVNQLSAGPITYSENTPSPPFIYAKDAEGIIYCVTRENPLFSCLYGTLFKAYAVLTNENNANHSISEVPDALAKVNPSDLGCNFIPYFIGLEEIALEEPKTSFTPINPDLHGNNDYAIIRVKDKNIDEEIKSYLIDFRHLLGRGGFSEVYMAYLITHSDFKVDPTKRVAVKVIEKGSFQKDELQIQRQYYPQIAAAVSNRDKIYMVIPYFPGRPLTDIMQGNDTPDLTTLASIICGIAQHFNLMAHTTSRTEAHIHRDAKGSNILYHGKDIYVLDFGIAKKVTEKVYENTVSGTVLHMAPEIITGETTLSSDVFALGIIFASLLGAKQTLDMRNKAYSTIIRKFAMAALLKNRHLVRVVPCLSFNLCGLFHGKIIPHTQGESSNEIKEHITTFIQSMLAINRSQRPNIDEVLRFFVAFDQYMTILSLDEAEDYKLKLKEYATTMEELGKRNINQNWQKEQTTYNTAVMCLFHYRINYDYSDIMNMEQSPKLCTDIAECTSKIEILSILRDSYSAEHAQPSGAGLLTPRSATTSSDEVGTDDEKDKAEKGRVNKPETSCRIC